MEDVTIDNGASTISPGEREIYSTFDRERGRRLARVVSIVFGGLAGVLLLGMLAGGATGVLAVGMGFDLRVIAIIVALSLYALAAWLTTQQHELLAGGAVVASTLMLLVVFQVTRERVHGLDAVVVATFAAYIVVIGLSGVLLSRQILFGITALMNVCTALICLLVPASAGVSQRDALIATVIIVAAQWTASLLYFGAATLYDQTLHELGNIKVAFERAQKLDELKNQFIANVNHELRNPIMALYTYVDLVRENGAQMTPAKRQELLDKAAGVGDRVLYLITSILDTRRIDQGSVEFTHQAVPLREALVDAATMIDPHEAKMVERPLHVAIPATLAIWGDKVMLQQILTNLLSNAIKYSPAGTPVEVSASIVAAKTPANERRDRRAKPATSIVEIRVRDHGLGVPPDQANLLFQRFVRLARDLESTVIGNGLGLYLCRVLAEEMDGRVWVESTGNAGEGSTFFLTLPLPPPDAPQPLTVTTPTREASLIS